MRNKLGTVLLGLVLLGFIPLYCLANVFPSGLAASTQKINPTLGQTVELSYHLNEAADQGVTVKVYNQANVVIRTLVGGASMGLNTVVWDGKADGGANAPVGNYYFEVMASDDGHTKWELISTDAAGNTIYSPRGIDVNKDPTSPYYGVIYITNSAKGTSANPGGYLVNDGVYSFYADATPVAVFTDTTIWSKASGNSPFRVSVDNNGEVYVGDYSDGWESVYSLNPALEASSLTQILARDDANGSTPPAGNHGNCLTAICRGVGADRIMYVTDEDFDSYDIWRFNIGTGPFPYNNTGTKLISEAPEMTDVWDFDVDKEGKYIYACDDQDAANPLNPTPPPSLSKWDMSTNPPTALWSSPTTAIVHNVDGIGFDAKNNIVAGGTRTTHKYIYIWDATTGALKDTLINPGGGRTRDVAFDAVGNLYYVNNSREYWRVFSPPDGANSSSTKAAFNIEVALAVDDHGTGLADDYKLFNCYPNPFNPSTNISFNLPRPEDVTLIIHNIRGEQVRQLVASRLGPGTHTYNWNGSDDSGQLLPTGIYFYQLQAGSFVAQKKMIFAK